MHDYVSQTSSTRKDNGKFDTLESVSEYEDTWHNCVYFPSFQQSQKVSRKVECENRNVLRITQWDTSRVHALMFTFKAW